MVRILRQYPVGRLVVFAYFLGVHLFIYILLHRCGGALCGFVGAADWPPAALLHAALARPRPPAAEHPPLWPAEPRRAFCTPGLCRLQRRAFRAELASGAGDLESIHEQLAG